MKTERQVSELSSEVAVLTPAEASVIEVPFAKGFDLEALKKVDDDPFFATVLIKAGKGDQGTGPLYDESLLQNLEAQFNSKRPPGYKGHQDPENVSWEYREPVTAWVGARFVSGPEGQGELYVKGYIPPTSDELRMQLRLAEAGADVINSVSIFGVRDVKDGVVTKFDLWSLDWTPKGRAGMETALVGVSGEQAEKEEVQMATREEVIASIQVSDVPDHVADALRKEGVASVVGETSVAGEMRLILELDPDEDPEAVVAAVRGLVSKGKTEELATRVEAATEEITVEMAREAVRDTVLPRLKADATEEEIKGEIDTALERPYIKALVDGVTIPVVSGGTGGSVDGTRQGTAWE